MAIRVPVAPFNSRLRWKLAKLIISAVTNMLCECRVCAGVASSLANAARPVVLGIFVLFRPQRLEGAESLRPTPQQKVPYRTTPEVRYLCREDCVRQMDGALDPGREADLRRSAPRAY